MTKTVVFDSFALIAHFRNEKGTDLISGLFSEIAFGEKKGLISVINVGEVYYMLHRKAGKADAEKSLKVIATIPIQIIDVDYKAVYQAAKSKAIYPMSYADSFAASLTIQHKGTLITGDPEFISIKEKDFKVKYINR